MEIKEGQVYKTTSGEIFKIVRKNKDRLPSLYGGDWFVERIYVPNNLKHTSYVATYYEDQIKKEWKLIEYYKSPLWKVLNDQH